MPRRDQISKACQACRMKRMKCNGQAPCARCESSGVRCVYDSTRRESKDHLRSEIERLRAIDVENQILLDALSSSETSVHDCNAILQGLLLRQSRRSIIQNLSAAQDERASSQSSLSPMPSSSNRSVNEATSAAASPSVLSPAMRKYSLAVSNSNSSAVSMPEDDYWTDTGWSKSYTRDLLDNVLSWDCLPFCILSRELFMRDFLDGSSKFCSSALVYALLSLTAGLTETTSSSRVHASEADRWATSESFARQAARLLDSMEHKTLPDIQAVGILSLHHLSRREREKGRRRAEDFARSIAHLRQIETETDDTPPGEEKDRDYVKARTSTYCGAIALNRMLHLVLDMASNPSTPTAPHEGAIQDQTPATKTVPLDVITLERLDDSDLLKHVDESNPDDLLPIAARIFQLAEWIYVLRTRPAPATMAEVETLYVKCLEWYSVYFTFLKAHGKSTPFTLFVHMCYHFCIMCIFMPLVNGKYTGIDDENEEKLQKCRDTCRESAHAILDLAQSCSELFTFRCLFGLMPYFITTSVSFMVGARPAPAPGALQDAKPDPTTSSKP